MAENVILPFSKIEKFNEVRGTLAINTQISCCVKIRDLFLLCFLCPDMILLPSLSAEKKQTEHDVTFVVIYCRVTSDSVRMFFFLLSLQNAMRLYIN